MLLLACLCAGPACCCWQAAASSICVSVHALQPPNSTLCERGHSVDSTLCVNMRNLQPPHSHLAGKGRNPAGRGISLLLPNSETACMGSGMPATSQDGSCITCSAGSCFLKGIIAHHQCGYLAWGSDPRNLSLSGTVNQPKQETRHQSNLTHVFWPHCRVPLSLMLWRGKTSREFCSQ